MKKIYKKSISAFAFLSLIVLGSCSEDFLEEKKDYNLVGEQDLEYPVYARQYVDGIYSSFLPGTGANAFIWDLLPGGNDNFTKTTDELAGETNWNKVWPAMLVNQDNCLAYLGAPLSTSLNNNPYTRIKNINIFLEKIVKTGMDDKLKNEFMGQMYFWRAYQYFELVKMYGGVPLVLKVQLPLIDGAPGVDDIKLPRNSSSECINQIVADLDMAKSLLPGKWNGNDWGRITSGAAAALKGRVLLTWASPLFNRTDDQSRWQRAYDANKEAKKLLEDNGFGLYQTGGVAGGLAWGNMWNQEVNNPEAVIVYGFNNSTTSGIRTNSYEYQCRPRVIQGNGFSPTKDIFESFPMIDGKPTSSSSATYTYNPKVFYKNRDPRFSKTFAYNGSIWKYAENASYVLWTYSWNSVVTRTTPDNFTEGNGNKNASGIYLRKATMDNAVGTVNSFRNSGTDFMEMRFAEVVLNLAESAIGIGNLSEGKQLIGEIRRRAGIINGDGSYGLADVTTRDQHFAAAINERKIEFAYESKRFHDLKRWMLFDNSTGQNTRLGIPVIDGMRRKGIFISAKRSDGSNYVGAANSDPFFSATGTPPVIPRNPTFPYTIPATGVNPGTSIPNAEAYLEYLYTNYFDIIDKDDLETTAVANWKFKWYPQYYFFCIKQNILDTAPYLEQTNTWGGTFDPLK